MGNELSSDCCNPPPLDTAETKHPIFHSQSNFNSQTDKTFRFQSNAFSDFKNPILENPNSVQLLYYDLEETRQHKDKSYENTGDSSYENEFEYPKVKMECTHKSIKSPFCFIKLNYPNGNPAFEGQANYDDITDEVLLGKLYHSNGQLYYQGNFVNQKPDGIDCTLYYSDGKIRYQGPIESGQVLKPKLAKEYVVNVGAFSIKEFLKGVKLYIPDTHCAIIYDLDSEQISYLGSFIDGRREGHGKLTYLRTGVMRYQGKWINDGPDSDFCTI